MSYLNSTQKRVRRLQDAGYIVTPAVYRGTKKPREVTVRAKNTKQDIAVVVINAQAHLIVVVEAWNQDQDPIKTLKLRDMLLSLWVEYAGLYANELETIKYKCIVNEWTLEPVNAAYSELSVFDPILHYTKVPKAFHADEDDREDPSKVNAVQILKPMRGMRCSKPHRKHWQAIYLRSPFVVGARAMVAEYPELKGRDVCALMFTDGDLSRNEGFYGDLYISLGKGGPSPEVLAELKAGLDVDNDRDFRIQAQRRIEAIDALNAADPWVDRVFDQRVCRYVFEKGMQYGSTRTEASNGIRIAQNIGRLSIYFSIKETLTLEQLSGHLVALPGLVKFRAALFSAIRSPGKPWSSAQQDMNHDMEVHSDTVELIEGNEAGNLEPVTVDNHDKPAEPSILDSAQGNPVDPYAEWREEERIRSLRLSQTLTDIIDPVNGLVSYKDQDQAASMEIAEILEHTKRFLPAIDPPPTRVASVKKLRIFRKPSAGG